MPEVQNYPRISRFKTPEAFRERLHELGLDLPLDDTIQTAEAGSPMAQSATVFGKTVGNRWCIHPMEGWDGTEDGFPSENTLRRWRRFGESGAKLIFGGEAIAVRHDGRANPNQLMGTEAHYDGLAKLLEALRAGHEDVCDTCDDLLVGLQLTHSGRFCRPDPDHKLKPRILYHHPVLDRKFGIASDNDSVVFTDDEIDTLIDCYITTAKLAQRAGYHFVDLKHCHGYLGHEFLSAHTRPGKYGGSFENRTRFLRTLVERIRSEVPGLNIGLRLSLFDFVPFQDDEGSRKGNQKGVGIPEAFEDALPYRFGFGVNPDNPLEHDLDEPIQFLKLLQKLGITLVNLSAGSPYYNPHIQRPALFPPSDGYKPPEDPLVGCHRQIQAVRTVKSYIPELNLIGTGYTYLQEYLPHVAQAVVREGWVDFVGLGRMVLSYPRLPLETLAEGTMSTKLICRTFSDCTTAPRNHLVSGCYPLDDVYKQMEEAAMLKQIKQNG